MKIYQTSTNGLWIGIIVFIVLIFSVVALGGFLLGTPLGLALLTLLVIRHYYKKHQRRRYKEQFETGPGEAKWQEESDRPGFAEDFASQYKQAEQDIKTFSTEDKYNAIDVEYKEI